MDNIEKQNLLDEIKTKEWKNHDKRYIFELQKFLDRLDNIKDEELKLSLIYQMIRFDNVITEICEEMIKKNI